jgi:hypothetical protein
MATLTKGKIFTSNEVVTPTKLNDLVDKATISNIVAADIATDAVTTAKILNLNVTTGKIADDAITDAKLADHATTDASRAVTTNHIRDLAVTTGKLATTVQQALLPAGAVMPFAMNAAPSGWLAANGAAVSRTTYAALFSAIGTTYGIGDGSTTFTLPDLRGYFVRGSGTNSDGTTAGTFGAKQTAYAGFNKYEVSMDDGDDRTGPRGEVNGIAINDTTIVTFNDRSITKTKEIETIPGDTRPKNIAMLYCIKF